MPDKLKKGGRGSYEEAWRVRATFEEAVEVLTRPVKVRYIPRPKRRPEPSALSYIIPNGNKDRVTISVALMTRYGRSPLVARSRRSWYVVFFSAVR